MVVPVLLGSAAVSIGSRSDILHVDVALFVQVAEQLSERLEGFGDVLGLLGLAVGFVGDLDVEVAAALALFGE